MINSIRLVNFQSHKDTLIDFTAGINIITGISDHGKSSIIRAIEWVVTNRPLGDVYANWDIVKKGVLTDSYYVEICTDKGTLVRKKSKTFNGYIINDEEERVVGTDVPKKVYDFLNIGDINIQSQFDKPFLVADTSGTVSKYLNKIVRLDKIDLYLSDIESQKRKSKQELEKVDNDIFEIKEDIEKYSWLIPAKRLEKKYNTINDKKNGYDAKISKLRGEIDKYKELSFKIFDFKKINQLLDKYNIINKRKKKRILINKELLAIIAKYKKYLDIKQDISFDNINKLLDMYKKINNQFIEKNEEKSRILVNIEEFVKYREIMTKNSVKLAEYKSKLPNTCPYCGSELKGAYHEINN